jgi:hypothetical protein
MLSHPVIPQTKKSAAASCPRLGVANALGNHYAVPCTLNICHADPLRRKGPYDLPLACQAEWCLGGDYRRCAYWQSCEGNRISLIGFILRQMRVIYVVCARSLQP